MNELEWFVSLLDKQDLVKIAQAAQVTITGFRNPLSAPKQRLQDEIRNAIRNGYNRANGRQRRRGAAPSSLDLKEFYRETGQELILRYPEYEHKPFYELILLLEGESLKPYEKVAVFYTRFESSYPKYLPLMIENWRTGNSLFYGFIEVLGLSRVESILQVHFNEELFHKYEDSFEEWVHNHFQPEQNRVITEMVKNQSDDELATYLARLNSMEQFVATFRFLQNGKVYEKNEYQNLVYYLILFYQNHQNQKLNRELIQFQREVELLCQEKQSMEQAFEQTNKERAHFQQSAQVWKTEVEQLKEQIRQLTIQNQILVQDKGRLEEEKKQEEKKNAESQRKMQGLKEVQEQISLLIEELRQDALIIRNQAPTWFRKIMGDRIKTRNYLTTALNSTSKRNTDLSRIQSSLVFLSRYTFESSTEWFITTQNLRQKRIDYVELTGMDAQEDLLQILEHLLIRKGEHVL